MGVIEKSQKTESEWNWPKPNWFAQLANLPLGPPRGPAFPGIQGSANFGRGFKRQTQNKRMRVGDRYHEPVMVDEVVHYLRPSPDHLILDGTLGGGGHSEKLLDFGASIIGLDQDPDALIFAKQRLEPFIDRFTALQLNFRDYPELLSTVGIVNGLDGILLDLGISSRQVDNGERGFSFDKEGPLDMRMNPSAEVSAADFVNESSEEDLIQIFQDYGEERAARRIAAEIVKERETKPILTTTHLAAVVQRVRPRRGKTHPATKVFQALRIAVNEELENLQLAMEHAYQWLKPGGRLVIITFHSLEDRMVKNFMRRQTEQWLDRPEWPEPKPNPDRHFQLVRRKALRPSAEEVKKNPRARSAKLRVVERVKQHEKSAKQVQ